MLASISIKIAPSKHVSRGPQAYKVSILPGTINTEKALELLNEFNLNPLAGVMVFSKWLNKTQPSP